MEEQQNIEEKSKDSVRENKASEQQLTKRERKLAKKEARALEQLNTRKEESRKKLMLWGTVAVLIIGSIYGIGRLANYSPEPVDVLSIGEVSASDHIKGSSDAKNILVEYSDFQCPACKGYFPLLKRLGEEEGENVLIVYRHFPLRSIHKNAETAARASEAASLQGKFWEMHNIIFENQEEWENQGNPKSTFKKYAERLELDTDKFMQDLGSSDVRNRVNKDYLSGAKANIPGTPTFFLNGKRIQTPRSYEQLKGLIQ